jgi:wobble nucleotide-excising tRNase
MAEESFRKIYLLLETHESTLQGELALLKDQEKEEKAKCAELNRFVEREAGEEARAQLEKLNWLEQHVDRLKKMKKMVERAIEEVSHIRREVKTAEVEEKTIKAETEMEILRDRRERIKDDLLPPLERRREDLLEETRDIDSRLNNLSEKLAKIKRQRDNVS